MDPLAAEIQQEIETIFPDSLSLTDLAQDNRSEKAYGEFLTSKEKILPFLQTLFFEERLIEIQIDRATRMFFGTLWDHPPELPAEENDGVLETEIEYKPGSYLSQMTHIILSPLEPAIGNVKVCTSSFLIMRFYSGTTAVELGTKYKNKSCIRSEPVFCLDFPRIGRILRNNRPFRAKIPKEHVFTVTVMLDNSPKAANEHRVIDFSPNGLSFACEKSGPSYQIGDNLMLTLNDSLEAPTRVRAIVRHLAKTRTKEGDLSLCGVQFDLESRNLAAQLESRFAALQRLFIRSLKERSEGQDIDFKLF